MLKINVIGAGRLGKTIAYLLCQHGVVSVRGICNSTLESAQRAAQFIGAGQSYASITDLPAADITFITTPDALIVSSAKQLLDNQNIKKGHVVIHCSGGLSSESLSIMKQKGCYIASIHPMTSFADPSISIQQYSGTYCAMEGDEEAITTVKLLFQHIQSKTYRIPTEKKILYHAGAVFCSNYVVTLAHEALTCLTEAGIGKENVMPVIHHIMQGVVSNLAITLSPEKSLTGPLKRGDIDIIRQHLEALDTDQKKLYSALGQATVKLTSHSREIKATLLDLFQQFSI